MDLVTALYSVGLLLLGLLSSTALYFVALLFYVHAKYDHLPGPKRTSFFLGNVPEIMSKTRKHNHDRDRETKKLKLLMHEMFIEWAERYGDTIVLFFMHKAMIITRSPVILKTVLVNSNPQDFPKSSALKARYLFGARYMGDGLATAVDHDSWYLRRKTLDPMFHWNQLHSSIDTFNSTGDSLINELQTYVESGETFKLSHVLHRSTLDVIMKAMFSMDTVDLNTEFHKIASDFVAESFQAIQVASIPLIEYNPMYYKMRKSFRKQLASFRELGARLILKRKAAICNGEDVPYDMLTAMIKSHLDGSAGYTFDIMVDEFLTIISAGMDTSANVLSCLFMELGRRSDLVQRLTAEVDEVAGKKAFISNEDISKLSFTTTLIKETLRMYPPATGLIRDVKKEAVLDGLRIPANALLMISVNGANVNQRYVDDADQFIPDRFDSRQEKRVPIYSFLTFSLGSRNCIGQVFAQAEMKVMITKFFQHFQLVLDESETFDLGQTATLSPLNELKCTLLARD